MSKILYIDDDDERWEILRNEIENPDYITSFPTVRSKDESDRFIDVSDYQIVFLHENNSESAEFIKQIDKTGRNIIVFSGEDYSEPKEEGTILKIHAKYLLECLPAFLKLFASGKNNLNCFKKKIFIHEAHNIRHKIVNRFSPFFLRSDSLIRKNNSNAFQGSEEYLRELKQKLSDQLSLLAKLRDIINKELSEDKDISKSYSELCDFFKDEGPFDQFASKIKIGTDNWIEELNRKKEELINLKDLWNRSVKDNLNFIINNIDGEYLK